MNESIGKAIRGCLAALSVITLVIVAYLAGYVGGQLNPAAVSAPQPAGLETGGTPEPAEPPLPEPRRAIPTPLTPTSVPRRSMDLYWEVWDLIEENYFGELPDESERLYGAIRGSLQTLGDDYTGFIDPEAAQIMRADLSGNLEGIGAVVTMNETDQIEIVRLLPGQPAEMAGVESGDVVLAVDGRSLRGMGLYDAIALIRGPQGTPVVLTLVRESQPEPFDVRIVRARIPLPTVEFRMLDGGIGYVRLYEFNSQATSRLREALEQLMAERPVALILDLRDNPGGYLHEAVSVADEFLPPGVVLYERTSEGEETVFRSTSQGLADEIPLAVLINGGSASASEIVAGAIQDRDRAPLVGEPSYGKGSVQEAHRLSNGGELRVTIAQWFTPNRLPISGIGLGPDYPVPYPEEDPINDRDPQAERAVELLLHGG